ncbi:MAG: Zn-ribbon domain-containing protein, partial [Methanospirillum sp.]|uniref:OapC/ArvC family zinc-ribbon domain-containing protein n=1 Tax=Methanospirillum sp. TaxID=45200 RepID=UPI002370E1B1
VHESEKVPATPTCDNKKSLSGDEEPLTTESVESIRIIEPGKYDLNLLRLVESDDRVIQVGKDGNYRLDLHSMIRSQKKH